MIAEALRSQAQMGSKVALGPLKVCLPLDWEMLVAPLRGRATTYTSINCRQSVAAADRPRCSFLPFR